ncbi:CHAT domain-containing protein [Nocardia sp. 2]|uniref:CHAT domain-containing protein n=1 Tax=Nocardia acididurans TaxID=2802282 RepID=A0ABS1MJH3_9NOCA|nr:CHAT domain-containing protein [Nocardia acididurans]MBL1079824.1 CHAT domain-containing protein [Nocardia acididurans]
MKKIVVNIQPSLDDGEPPTYFVEADGVDRATKRLDLSGITPLEGPQSILKVGEALADLLVKHDRIEKAFDRALAVAVGEPSVPIYFFIGVDTAVPLSWEALRRSKQFLALDPRWPIARFPRSGSIDSATEVPFAPPLRMVSVISAVGVDGKAEWDSIFGAVQAAPAELPIELTVITGDRNVVAAARGHLPPERIIPLPGPDDPMPLVSRIDACGPHLLHIFCHGAVREEQAVLEFATASDFNAGTSSVVLTAIEIAQQVSRNNTWMVHLNACRSAQAGSEVLTHAEEFVNTGVPVAIGMKRLIDVSDAVVFSAGFYRSVFARIAEILARGAGRSEIAWAETMLSARRQLRNIHVHNPAEGDAWTVPVMYTRRGPFTLEVAAAGVTEPQVQQALSETRLIDGLAELIAADAPEVAADLRAVSEK